MAAEEQKVIFSMVRVSKSHGQKQVLRDISLGFFYGAKIGVLGLNGAGKSTLLKIMAGVEESSNGEVVRAPGYTVGLLEQEPELEAGKTVLEIVEQGAAESKALLAEFDELADRFSEPMDDDEMQKVLDRQADVQEKIDAVGAWELDSRLELAMDALRCPPPDTVVDVLSGGERRRVALCRLLIQQPDILLLDEPTNHLDALSVGWLERHLKEYPGTVIAVTHDRYFLDNVAGWILELDRGHGIPWKGNYSSWLEQKEEQLRQEQRSEGRRQKTLERELEWIRMAPRARHAKGKARVNAYQELLSQEPEVMVRELEIFIPHGPRLGDVVIEGDGLSKGFGDRLLFDDLSFSIPPGAIVGIIGGNGAGKTTLFELITRQQEPDAGHHQATGARRRQSEARGDGKARLRRPEPVNPGPREVSMGGHFRGIGVGVAGPRRGQFPRLRRPVQFHGIGSAETGQAALWGRAQPRAPGEDAQRGCQRPDARRAHQRPRRQHPAGPRGGDPRLCRNGVGDLPGSDPHAGLRGRFARRVVSRPLLGLPRRPTAAPW
jgi:ATPase subunit of ABC transporter with duplicated ATPase domains